MTPQPSACSSRHNFSPMLGAALVLLAGCGESRVFSLNPGHIDSSDETGLTTCFDGAGVELLRYSSRCERASTKSLVTEVADGMEFGADEVRTLESPCAEGPNPGVEVYLENTSLLFDFSNVASPGQFPPADFEGYIIELTLRAHNSLLVAATVDPEQSTIALDNSDITHEPDHIEVNFESVSYDDHGFIKIDLWFANVAPPIDGDS